MDILIDAQHWLYGGSADGLKVVASSADPIKLMAALGFAVLFGSVHALMPGHGKSVLMSYYLRRPSRIAGGVASSAFLVMTHVGMAIVLVLTGFIVVQRTLAGAGRTPALETMSSALIIGIGAVLLVTALRGHNHEQPSNNPLLAIAAGFVPCPLTTFIMVYAASNGMIVAGLLVTAAMASGMILTVSLFAFAAVFLRERLFRVLARRDKLLHGVGHAFEILSAFAVIASGIWLLTAR
jgi:nickel/cobalt transporter (NicO) family protein